MSKINIKFSIKSENTNQNFQGKGIKKDNTIIFYENKIKNKITISNFIIIERQSEYYLKLNFKKSIKTKGQYINKYGKLNLETNTKQLEINENELKIIYDLYIEKEYVDTFYYILKFSLDSN